MRISKNKTYSLRSSIHLTSKLILKDFLKINNRLNSNDFHIKKGIDWLVLAQNLTKNGGVSKGYNLFSGWLPSYPETSGYIIPTLIDYSDLVGDKKYLKVCEEIADWECSIQLRNGAFKANKIKDNYIYYIFDTGQILIGLLRAYKKLKKNKYLNCAIKAGNFIAENQDEKGTWKKFTFQNLSHTYNVRVAWILLELFLITNEEKFKLSAIKNIEWTLKQMTKNFWFKKINYTNAPLTHFISYTIRGLLESGIILNDSHLKKISLNSALQLMNYFDKYNNLPATFNSEWCSKDHYSCLTGNAQLSIIWLKLYKIFGDKRLLLNAKKLNNYLKKTQVIDKNFKFIDGAIKGSDPIWGKYARFTFPNWAAKFFCDALILEKKHNDLFKSRNIIEN